MTHTANGSPLPPMLTGALAWLDAPASGDVLLDLAPMRDHLGAIVNAPRGAGGLLPLLHRFQKRVDAVDLALKPKLHQSSLPLPYPLPLIAHGLTDIHGLMATGALEAARAAGQNPDGKALALALHNLAEQQQVALMAAAAPPADLWRQALLAHSLLERCPPGSAVAGQRLFKGMLALAAAQPETFAGSELGTLAAFLRGCADDVVLDRQPQGPLDTWYWLDESRALPPAAVARRPPAAGGRTLYFSCWSLASRADEALRRLAAGESPAAIGLPMASTEDCRLVLDRARARWSAPPRRRHPHRSSGYAVEICSELDGLWQLLRTDASAPARKAPSKWMVLNESPGGFAMMHLSGAVSGLAAGGALGLRTAPERPWNICLIRWARSDNPVHIEVGLELIAPSAAAVEIVRGDQDNDIHLARALLLRPANVRDRREALLTARGTAGVRPFTLIAEPEGKLQLTECQVERLALQTSSVEMLEFSRDFTACWSPNPAASSAAVRQSPARRPE